MKYDKRFIRLEKLVKKEECIPAIALQFLNGIIDWSDRIFPNEDEFNKAVESTFRNEVPKPGPRVVIITFWRKMEDYNLDKIRRKQVSVKN